MDPIPRRRRSPPRRTGSAKREESVRAIPWPCRIGRRSASPIGPATHDQRHRNPQFLADAANAVARTKQTSALHPDSRPSPARPQTGCHRERLALAADRDDERPPAHERPIPHRRHRFTKQFGCRTVRHAQQMRDAPRRQRRSPPLRPGRRRGRCNRLCRRVRVGDGSAFRLCRRGGRRRHNAVSRFGARHRFHNAVPRSPATASGSMPSAQRVPSAQ